MQPRSRRGGERLRLAVLMGGPSSEHEVSLDGGQNVVEALDLGRFEVRPVVIARDGRWWIRSRALRPEGPRRRAAFDPRHVEGWRPYRGPIPAIQELATWPADVVLPVLHGPFGEDGTVQACLAAAGLPFVGSGSLASGIANDKVRTKEILSFHGVPTPRFEVLGASELARGRSDTAERLVAAFGAPLVLKDPTGGSSLEVRIADDAGAVAAALDELSPPATRVLVEAYVRGRELTAGVLDDRERGEPVALPIVEIRPRSSRTFDYREKYAPDGAEELCPAPIPPEVEAEARRLGLLVHTLLGLKGLSRTDLIWEADRGLEVLEVNTIPGLTPRSLVPRAARALGIEFSALVENLIRTASPG